MVVVRFNPFSWSDYTAGGPRNEIIAHSFLENEERCLVRVKGFQPWVHLKLPTTKQFEYLDWRNTNVKKAVVKSINLRLRKKSPALVIQRISFVEKRDINHYSEKKQPMYKLYFNAFYGRKAILEQFNYKSKEPGNLFFFYKKRKYSFTPDFGDHMVESYNQLLITNNCTTTAWLEGKMEQVPKNERISTHPHEYAIDYDRDNPIFQQLPNEIADHLPYHPLVAAFDIETRTPNYKRMPVMYWDEHHIFMLSIDSKRSNTNDPIKRKVFLYGDAHDISMDDLGPEAKKLFGGSAIDVEIERCPSEKILLIRFFEYLVELDPDILSGYNIHGYDLPYINQRRFKYRLEYPQACSRLKYIKPKWNPFSWSSSAHTKVSMDKIEMPGRVYIDLYAVVYKDFKSKLPKFKLDTVLRVLLKKNKFSPVSYEDLFRAFDAQDKPRKLMRKCVKAWVPESELSPEEIASFQEEYGEFTSGYGYIPIFHDNVSPAVIYKIIRLHEEAKKQMRDPVIYSDYDSFACIELFEFLSTSIVIKELAGISRVNPQDIYSRGEQAKGVALIAYSCYHQEYVMFKDLQYSHLNSKGGFVGDMTVGLTPNTICLDFNSLYPNEMITNNLCPTTLIHQRHYHLFDPDDENDVIRVKCPEERKHKDDKGKEYVEVVEHEFWFSQRRRGIIPELQKDLIAERKKMKQKMFENKGGLLYVVNNARQLGLKVSGNSLYGMLTIGEMGKLPCKPVGMATAAKGREHILLSNQMIEAEGGTVVYNDTDSTIYTMPGVTGKDCVLVGKQHEKKFSALFPGTLYFEFEKAGTFFGYTKKRYIIWKIVDDENSPNFGELYPIDHADAFIIRGILIARKDNARIQRDLFSQVLFGILQGMSYAKAVAVAYKIYTQLLMGHVPWDHLLIIKGVGASYKSETAMMKVFKDKCELEGNPIQAGERVDFIVEHTPKVKGEKEKTVGQKACLPKEYMRKKEEGLNPRPDIIYYMDKALRPSVQQTIEIGFDKYIRKSMKQQKLKCVENIFDALEESLGLAFVDQWYDEKDPSDAYDRMIDYYHQYKGDELKAKKKEDPQFKKEFVQVHRQNIQYFTSTNILKTEPNDKPLAYYIRALKIDLKKGNTKYPTLRRFLEYTCKKKDYRELCKILDSEHGNWEIQEIERNDEPDEINVE